MHFRHCSSAMGFIALGFVCLALITVWRTIGEYERQWQSEQAAVESLSREFGFTFTTKSRFPILFRPFVWGSNLRFFERVYVADGPIAIENSKDDRRVLRLLRAFPQLKYVDLSGSDLIAPDSHPVDIPLLRGGLPGVIVDIGSTL